MQQASSKALIILCLQILGLIFLGLLIWFVGPLLAIDEYRPLAGIWSRVITITIPVLIWLLLILRTRKKAKSAEQQLLNGLTQSEYSQSGVSTELQKMDRDFNEALNLLKRPKPGKKTANYLYAIPWYIIIGPPGSGKTTLLVNSGLNFPLSEQFGDQSIKGVGGTRNCDWWFANQAVLIDTAGRYTTQDSDSQRDQQAWHGFLNLLKQNRPRRPVNGAFIALSLADFLLLPENELKLHAQAIKNRILELDQQLGIKVPVYMMFTKCDLIAGFNEFFEDLDSEARAQVWGQTFQLDRQYDSIVDAFAAEYAQLLDRIDQRLLSRLQDEQDSKKRSLIFGFPRQMESLTERILEFLNDVFRSNRYQEAFFLRGVYFTSGTQEGSPIDHLMGSLAGTYGLDRQETPLFSGQGRSYFITRLLTDVIFQESELAGQDRKKERCRRVLQYALYGVTGLALLLGTGLWLTSYNGNINKINNQQSAVTAYQQQLKQARWQLDFEQLLPRLNSLEVAKDQAFNEQDGLFSKAGLYQGDKLQPAAESAYQRFQKRFFLPAIRYRFEERLQDAIADNQAILYELLKAYLMLNNLHQRDPEVLKAWVSVDWELDFSEQADKVNELNRHLDYLLAMPPEAVPLNQGLINEVRRVLTRIPRERQIYSRIKSETAGNAFDFNARQAMGPYADRVFSSNKGELDQLRIPGLYTLDGFQKIFLKRAPEIIDQAVAQDWVLNRIAKQAGSITDLKALQHQIQALYVQDYISYWRDLLFSVHIKSTANIDETIELLGYLSGKSSPFKLLLATISNNTRLSETTPLEQTLAQQSPSLDSNSQAALGALKEKALGARFKVDTEAVDRHFAALHKLTGSAAGQPGEVDLLVEQFGELYAALIEMQGGAGLLAGTVNSGQSVAQLSNRLRQLQLEIQRLPQPASDWVENVVERAGAEVSNDVKRQLTEVWGDVASQCKDALQGRYPFSKGSRREVNLMDFGRFFSRQGIIAGFFQQNLKPYVDTSRSTWRLTETAAENLNISEQTVRQFQYAAVIRDKYFKFQGEMPQLRFTLKPVLKSADIATVILDIDGQLVEYSGGPDVGKEFQWPGIGAGGYVKVDFEFANGIRKKVYQMEGPWALFRLIDVTATGPINNRSDRFTIKLNHGASYAKFEILTGGGINPFNTLEMKNFRCPRRL